MTIKEIEIEIQRLRNLQDELSKQEIDERLAQILRVKSVEHYASEDGGLIALIAEE